ncbi:hypothetical protein ABZ370_38565 [Streptomyces sp. NPDC005962]|uniref:hypothetical protein n=1 Tax=Streptomyces sp. NPDC005962 TaxID=3154466 RepID=UPI0033FCB73A
MADYRDVAEQSLVECPGDTFSAGVAVFLAHCRDKHAWADAVGIPNDRETRSHLLPARAPDFQWIAEEFDTKKVPIAAGREMINPV